MKNFHIPSAVRHFFVLAGGAGSGQLVVLAITPLLTRLLSPADFGLFGTFTTFVALLSVTSSLGFETAIISARQERASALVGISFTCTVVLTLAAMGIFAVLIVTEAVTQFPLWIPALVVLCVITANAFTALQYWYIREHHYRQAGIGTFSQYAGRGVGWIACALALPSTLAMPVGDVIGRTISVVVIDRLRILPRALVEILLVPKIGMQAAREYWKSAMFLMPSSALEVGLTWLPVLLCSTVYGIELAGQVALVQRLLSAPLAIIGRSASDIYQVRITGHGTIEPGRILRATLLVVGGALAVALPGCLFLIFLGPPVFAFVFGAQWAVAGHIAAILAPLAAMQLCGGVITRLLIEVKRQEVKFFAYVVLHASMLSSFYVGYIWSWTIFTTLMVMSLSGCVLHLVWFGVSLAICRKLK